MYGHMNATITVRTCVDDDYPKPAKFTWSTALDLVYHGGDFYPGAYCSSQESWAFFCQRTDETAKLS